MPLSKKAWFAIAGVLMVALAIAGYLIWEKSRIISQGALKIMADHVDLQVKNIEFTEVGDSGEKWEIKADLAHYIKKENLGLFDKVTVTLILADGRTLIMQGDRARMRTDTKDLEISGNVLIVSDKGDRFTTDNLKYTHAEHRIYTDQPVQLENGKLLVKGVGMTFLLTSREIKLLSKVKAQIK